VETLATRISRDGPLNELDAVGWAIRLAKRIEALHALGVAHGAISPECVLTAAVDRTSKAILADLRQTPSRIAYQSPERIAGGTLSPGDDVWAIAATLYEVLTGASAFGGASDAETRQRIANASPAPLAVFDVGDDDLQRVLDDAFQRDRSLRTTNAAAFRRALEEWHPDPAARTLLPLDDEDSTNDDEDDDEVRTLMRPAPLSSAQLNELIAQRTAALQAGQPPTPAQPARSAAPAAPGGAAPPRPGVALAPRAAAAAVAPAAGGRAPVARGRVPGVGAVPLTQSFGDDREPEDDLLTIMRGTPPLGAHVAAGPAAATPPGGTASAAYRVSPAGRPGVSAASQAAASPDPSAAGAPAPPLLGRDRPGAGRDPRAGSRAQADAVPRLVDPAEALDDELTLDAPTLNAPALVDAEDDEDDVPTRTREAPLNTPAAPHPAMAAALPGSPPALAGVGAHDRPAAAAAAPLDLGAGARAASAPRRGDAGVGPAIGPGPAAAGAFSPPPQASPRPQSALAALPSAAPVQAAALGSDASPPSPFGGAGGVDLESDMPPDRSGRLGMIIAVIVALLLAGGAMLFAAQMGLLGAAPAAPRRVAEAAVVAPTLAPAVARPRAGRLLVEALDLGVEAAHVDALQHLGPEA
jgi:hypothetical protein